jgi:hypothetical protein
LLYSCSVTLAASPALWQASRTPIKKLTSILPFVLLRIKQKATGSFYFLRSLWSIKTRAWCAILLVHPWLPKSSKSSILSIFWLTSRQTWDNTRDIYQILPVNCPWVH